MQWAPESDVFLRMNASVEAGDDDLRSKRWAEAERHYTAGLALNSLSDTCYYRRAIALFEQAKMNEALQDIDRAIKLAPEPQYHHLRAEILSALNHPAEARDARNAGNAG